MCKESVFVCMYLSSLYVLLCTVRVYLDVRPFVLRVCGCRRRRRGRRMVIMRRRAMMTMLV